jgi:transketolase
VDYNQIQLDGLVKDIMVISPLKGQDVSFMENNPKFHGVAPTQDELKLALQELS